MLSVFSKAHNFQSFLFEVDQNHLSEETKENQFQCNIFEKF